jgi:dihydrofolate reductase
VRKLIVSELVSIDYKLREALEAESLLIGRVTYESFVEGWSPREGEFADKMNGMPKHVVSTTLKRPEWNATVISSNVPDEIARIRQGDGGPILVAGSRTLVHTLMEHGLVDEYRFMIFPVILGSGRRVFPDTPNKAVLRLTDSRAFSNGVVLHAYQSIGV